MPGGSMADDVRPLLESFGDLPRRVRGVNWRVPGQAGAADMPAEQLVASVPVAPSEFASSQPLRPQAGGKLPKRVPGTSAFRPAPRRVRVRPLPAGQAGKQSSAPMPPAVVQPGSDAPRASAPRPRMPVRSMVPTVPPPASLPRAQPPPVRAEPRRPARARAWRWWLVGLLVVVVAAAAVLVMTLHH